MTVIAWDGTRLAADKRTSFGSVFSVTTKVHRVRDMLCAGCGTTALVKEMIDWLERGADPAKFPAQQRDSKESVSLLCVPRSGPLLQYETSPFPLTIENRFWAIGSGRDFAMMAMHLGKTAEEAVLLTAELCHDCGSGVDVLTRAASMTILHPAGKA